MSAPSTQSARLPRSLWVGLGVVLVAEFMDLVDATIVSVALPSMAADLGMSSSQVQWTLAGYTLAVGALMITGGRIGDLYGRRRVFLIGLTAGTLFAALTGIAPTAEWMLVGRALSGAAAAFTVPLVLGLIRATFPPHERGKALSIYGASLGLAAVVGPILGGALVTGDPAGLGWRAVFWVNVPIGILALIVGWFTLTESRDSRPPRVDAGGVVLVTAASALLLLPLIQGREQGWPLWTWLCFGGAAMSLLLLVLWERRVMRTHAEPLIDLGLFRRSAFSAGLIVSMLFFGGIGSYFLLLVLYLQGGTGRDAWETGLVLLPYAVGSFLTSALSVQLAARAGRALMISGALLLATAQVLLLLLLGATDDLGYWAIAAPLFVGGLGLGLTAPPLIDVVLSAVDDRHAGAAAGVLTTSSQIGNALGVAVLGSVFFAALGTSDDAGAADYADALAAALPWQVGAYVAASGLMILLPKRARAELPDEGAEGRSPQMVSG